MTPALPLRLTALAFLLVALPFHHDSSAQLPDYGWARAIEGFAQASPGRVAMDHTGAVYWFSTFTGTVDLDPGPGSANITAQGSGGLDGDAFVAKYAQDGTYLWHIVLSSGLQYVYLRDLAINDATGELVFVGYYRGNLDLEPGPASLLGNSTNDRYFMARYGLDGQYISAVTLPATPGTSVKLTSVIYDADGGYVVGGECRNVVDIDPVGVTNVEGEFDGSAFVAKYDALSDLEWYFLVENSSGSAVMDLAFAPDGDLLITGTFWGTSVDFDPGPGNSATVGSSGSGYEKAFLARYSATREFRWALPFGNSGARSRGFSLLMDATGASYMIGMYDTPNSGAIFDLDPGPGENVMPDDLSSSNFVVKFNAQGEHQWGYANPGYGTFYYGYNTADPIDEVVLFGDGASVLLYDDEGPAVVQNECGESNPYCISLSTEGEVSWYAMEGSTCSDGHGAEAIAFDGGGGVVVLGNYYNTPDASYGTVADHLPDYETTHPYLMSFRTGSGTSITPLLDTRAVSPSLTTASLFDVQGRLVHYFQGATTDADALQLLRTSPVAADGIHLLRGIDAQGHAVVRKVALLR